MKLYLSVILLVLQCSSLLAGEIHIEGIYLGRNLYVRNPFDAEKEVFCINEIYVNDRLLISDSKISAIQIPLESFQLNEQIKVKIVHRDGCVPEIVNPEVISKTNSFSFLYFQIDENSINWITRGEALAGSFVVEQMKYQGWTEIYTRTGKGKIDYNQYIIEAKNYSGQNRYRIVYNLENGGSFKSEEVEYFSLLEPVEFFPTDSVTEWISLTRDADYNVLDNKGKILKSGFGNTINVDDLDYGEYRIVIENDEDFFVKPKPKITYRKKSSNKN